MVNRKTNTAVVRRTSKTAASNGKTKIIAGAVSLAVVAGGAGYAVNEIIKPNDLSSPEPVYTVTYYKLRKAKNILNNELAVRSNNESSKKFNSNGYVPEYWSDTNESGCNTRYDMLFSFLSKAKSDGTKCGIQSGELFDYYTGKTISDTSKVHIDHVVSKKNAWDSGGDAWDADTWKEYVNDEKRVLITTSAEANQQKGSSDAAGWLPSNIEYQCKYVIQQIEIKKYYDLTVRQAEKDVMNDTLDNNCKTK